MLQKDKRVLICGVSGQDGSLLAKFLLELGNYEVWGTSRDAQISSFQNLKKLNIRDKVNLISMSPTDFRSVLQGIEQAKPQEIYYLAGQSSVGLSFQQPVETLESLAFGTINVLESIRFLDKTIKFYGAGSSECFGNIEGQADESVPFRPRSPYAVAKATAFWETVNYREAYDLYACSGILFNHESYLRPERFVTQKIIRSVCKIAQGKQEKLLIGNTNIRRDWGWATEYIQAMYLMLQRKTPEDYVIATGASYSLQEFIETAFYYFNLDWRKYVEVDQKLYRPADIFESRGNPNKAKTELGWQAKYKMPDVVKMMIEANMRELNHEKF